MINTIMQKLLRGERLTPQEAGESAQEILDGSATPVQTAAFLTALRIRGENVEEITAFADAMRSRAIRINPKRTTQNQEPETASPRSSEPKGTAPDSEPLLLVDTCGTGGDSSNTFNISTASALIASAAGIAIAKHGNRSVSSSSGSADVLEKLGIGILEPLDVEQCIESTGFGFMFAPYFHPAMKQVAGIRKELGFRTIFNIIGPLANPAGAKAQVVGVFDPKMTGMMAECLLGLGAGRAMVVHSEGMDEIGLGTTTVSELKAGKIETYNMEAASFGIARGAVPVVHNSTESAAIIKSVLSGAAGPARDICLLNAAAAIYVGGKAKDIGSGIERAANAIDSGNAMRKLEEISRFTAERLSGKG